MIPSVRSPGGVVASPMRRKIEISPHRAVLVVCTLALLAMVYSGGWSWSLKAAAVMIPVSFLVG